jgi:hypothetical protein
MVIEKDRLGRPRIDFNPETKEALRHHLNKFKRVLHQYVSALFSYNSIII